MRCVEQTTNIHDSDPGRRRTARRRLAVLGLMVAALVLLAALDALIATGPALGMSAVAVRLQHA